MKIFICCSKHHYSQIPPIKEQLESMGHTIILPNSYENVGKESELKAMGPKEHQERKASMIRLSIEKILDIDAMLVLNMEKNGQKNYIGGATFLEIFKAFELHKKIFFYNPIPEGMLYDELLGMGPIIIHHDISLIK